MTKEEAVKAIEERRGRGFSYAEAAVLAVALGVIPAPVKR